MIARSWSKCKIGTLPCRCCPIFKVVDMFIRISFPFISPIWCQRSVKVWTGTPLIALMRHFLSVDFHFRILAEDMERASFWSCSVVASSCWHTMPFVGWFPLFLTTISIDDPYGSRLRRNWWSLDALIVLELPKALEPQRDDWGSSVKSCIH